ncbi:TPA: hypothetical protein N0F65_010983 [Lagenidium giganteum]|uniref:Uncharacterized protein n=1 Tax=Lagenidium giganteum TaxID=4803 RepID=A0AAV2Z851_9STRA|nr:TPA: hypothetical protein N0F65_010983 [Lagenidium giganteum]
MCPILALGIYWATYSIDSTDCHLFADTNNTIASARP